MAHILIIDDDDIVAGMASAALIDAGHACGWVSGGEEGLRLLAFKRPDVILLDQDMPGMSGKEVMRTLRSSPDFYDLPIIMFTGMSGKQDEATARYHGAQAYVRKPFNNAALVRVVENVLEARAERPQHTDLRDWMKQKAGWYREDEDAGLRRAI